jgi:DnaJ-class molecular chaperone
MKCKTCEGKGEIITSGDIYYSEPKEMPDICPDCGGSGKVISKDTLSEEEAIQEIHKMSKYRIKSAWEETDEYIDNLTDHLSFMKTKNGRTYGRLKELKQLIAAERAERKEG